MNFLQRFPFAILGAFGLVSLASGVIELERHIADWVTVWKAATHPIWEFLFGWFFEWVDWNFPGWVKDYLTLSAICTGGFVRWSKLQNNSFFLNLNSFWYLFAICVAFIIIFFIWIPMLVSYAVQVSYPRVTSEHQGALVFFETFIYALIIIAASYALIFSGVSSPAVS